MSRWEIRERKIKNNAVTSDYIESTTSLLRKRVKNRQKLSLSEIHYISYRVIVENELLKDVAKEFRISIPTVFSFVKKFLKNKQAVAELQ